MKRITGAVRSTFWTLTMVTLAVAGATTLSCKAELQPRSKKLQQITAADKNAAAGRAAALGMLPGVAGLAVAPAPGVPLPGMEGPGGVPHYFGPY
ncbi:MAG TPA: hypothetical protein VLT61_16830, partial [Anaeromyxobacteraceae bacterium]|nr:hypothetical protein [Anaeromyxobacteraceae bacterium]